MIRIEPTPGRQSFVIVLTIELETLNVLRDDVCESRIFVIVNIKPRLVVFLLALCDPVLDYFEIIDLILLVFIKHLFLVILFVTLVLYFIRYHIRFKGTDNS